MSHRMETALVSFKCLRTGLWEAAYTVRVLATAGPWVLVRRSWWRRREWLPRDGFACRVVAVE
jgi:hypothetical protein